MAKSPVPIKKRIVLPADPGNYELVFVRGQRSDIYTLNVQPESVELEAKGSHTFTSCEESGRLMRVSLHWLWVHFEFLSDKPLQRMTAKRDAVLGDLLAMGAKPFTPPPGRYLFNGFGRQVPLEPQSHTDEEEYFFQWHGDWLNLQKVANRYRKYSAIVPKRPMIRFWLVSRDNVISTSNGEVWSFIQEKAPPSARGLPCRPCDSL
jgi:hypothetical protein